MPLVAGQRDYFDQVLDGLDARDQRLDGVEFNGCTFKGGSLAGAQLLRCKLLDCRFVGVDLSNVVLTGSTLRDVTAEDAKLLGVNWTAAAALAHLTMRRCVLSYGNFTGLDLRKSTFEDCIAREVEWAHANLADAVLSGTDFAGSRFLQTNLTKADFRGAKNYAIRALDNKIAKAKFSMPEATALLFGLDVVVE